MFKVLNEVNNFSQELSFGKWKKYRKALSAQTLLRYMTVVYMFILAISEPIPQPVTNAFLVMIGFFPFMQVLQLSYSFYKLAVVSVQTIQEHFWMINVNVRVERASFQYLIYKTATDLMRSNQLKNHLEEFYSLLFLSLFSSIFVISNCNVSQNLKF